MSATTDRPTKPANEDRRWELLLLISSLAAALLFGVAAYSEIAMAPWRKYQREYRSALAASATDERTSRTAESFEIRYYQSYLPGLGRVDRCLPCHTTGHNPDTNAFVEPNIGCEACHGPGKDYVADALAGNLKQHKALAIASVLEKDRCLNCHRTMHIATEKHEATIRDKAVVR